MARKKKVATVATCNTVLQSRPRKGRITYGTKVRYFLGDTEVTKAEFDAAFPTKAVGECGGHAPACWPMVSEAMAVHPDQVDEANARAKRHGLTGVKYQKGTGMVELSDRGSRRQLLRLEGYHDNHAGYGD